MRASAGVPLIPLPSLLFNLVAKSFTILVNQLQKKGWLEGISIPKVDESIHILQYADDTVLHGSGYVSSKIPSYLTIFSLISGLKINLHKTVVYGVGHYMSLESRIASELGCQVGTLSLKYLGLPFGGRSLSCADWNQVMDVFWSKLSMWKVRHLFMGGCLTLIKSLLSSIPIYPLSVRLFSVHVWNTLHDIMSNLLWGGSEDKRKLHLVDWASTTRACSKGGLGVPDLGQ